MKTSLIIVLGLLSIVAVSHAKLGSQEQLPGRDPVPIQYQEPCPSPPPPPPPPAE